MAFWGYTSVLLLFIVFYSGNSLKINDDGGYEIVVALHEATPASSIGGSQYLENIKHSLNVFSRQLWRATKDRFYLKSVDILLPPGADWNIESSATASMQSYESADVRLSPNVTYPHVENPNICGQAGNYIELPDYFFNVTNSGPYGLHWKTLLHSWAMFRYGVHPEHGFIGDTKYPYAQRDLHTQEWAPTGCSNNDIKGRFVDVTNPDARCESTGTSLSNNCRFMPDPTGQTATSSLMHFHWLESVSEFCDEVTHDKFARNKQNDLCDHQSVWEVIRSSPDYLAVNTPRHSIPQTKFRTVRHNTSPLLYMLIDRGQIQGSYSNALRVPPILANFSTTYFPNILAAVGAYPGNSAGSYVTDLVEWSEIGRNSGAFVDAIGTLRSDGPLERDFSRALVQVAEKIKNKNHPSGAVVLLVKYGADVKNFGSYLPESEVVHAFNEGNIIFNAIELNFTNHAGHSHLSALARGTGGTYTVVSNYGEVETNVENVLRYMRKILLKEYDYSDLNKNWKLLGKESLNTISRIPVSDDLTGSVEAFISTRNSNLSMSNFLVSGYKAGESSPVDLHFRLTKTTDWNEAGSKLTYWLDVPKSALTNVSQILVRLSCDCSSNILARAVYSKTKHGIEIKVGTSVQDGQADLSSGRPIILFAKVTKNRIPVQDALVTATLTDTSSSRSTTIPLKDNGEASPDAQEHDGVYSAYFAPEIDGQYKVSVTVKGNPVMRRKRSIKNGRNVDENAFNRLLPIDQVDVGCGSRSCESEVIEGSFSQTVEMTVPITVVQAWQYRPTPPRVKSFLAIDRPDLGQVNLFWLAPEVPGRSQRVTSYELRSAPSMELLISSFINQTVVPLPPRFEPNPPPSMEQISITRPSTTTFYAVRSTLGGKNSAVSNIASVSIASTPTTVPPTSSTSTLSSSGSTSPEESTTTATPTTTTDSPPETPPETGKPPTSQSTTNPTNPTSSTQGPTSEETTTQSTTPTTTPSTGAIYCGNLNYSLFVAFLTFLVSSFSFH